MAAKEAVLKVAFLGDASRLDRTNKKVKQELTGLEKFSKKIGSSFKTGLALTGISLGAASIVSFLKESAKAAGEDQRAQDLLHTTMKRVANATDAQVKGTEAMIGRMEMATGIADDELRPAMGKLISVTHNTKKAQDYLKIALGASAKSGKPLATVTQALSKYLGGNKKALERLFPELIGTTDQMGKLKTEVVGLAAKNADPFQKLQRNLDNLKETIGGPLVKNLSTFIEDLNNPQTPEGKIALKTMNDGFQNLSDSIGTLFKQFTTDGSSATGFMNVMIGMSDTLAASIEGISTGIAFITGKQKPKTPALDAIGAGLFGANYSANVKLPKNFYYNYQTAAQAGLGVKNRQAPYLDKAIPNNTYNITVKAADLTTAAFGKSVVKAIQNYQKSTGRTYIKNF